LIVEEDGEMLFDFVVDDAGPKDEKSNLGVVSRAVGVCMVVLVERAADVKV
jgi:hypothetical protein